MLYKKTRSDSIGILSRMDIRTQQAVEMRIEFLQEQLNSLDHYLPETYQFLMAELDSQQRILMEIRIHQFYEDQSNEQQNQNPDQRDPKQDQKSPYGSKGVQQ